MIRFAQPLALILLLVPPLVLYWMFRRRGKTTPKMLFSSTGLLGLSRPSLKIHLRPLPRIFVLLSTSLLILALARPQSPWQERRRNVEGIDIMLVTDVSESMRALDFRPNRLVKAKAVMKDFIAGREGDQIGIVIFARETFTICPLTHDYQALQAFVEKIDFDIVDGRQTAIGMGLANAVSKLKDSPAKSKVVILLTDGENNYGTIPPRLAAEIAKQLEARTYTIGIGSRGNVEMPVLSPSGRWTVRLRESNLDVELLREIAEKTGGEFFHATDGETLEKIFETIDQLETTDYEVTETNYYDELSHYLIIPGLILLALAFVLEQTWLWTFP